MDQIPRHLTEDQARAGLRQYMQGTLNRVQAQEMLGLAKTRFFAFFQEDRQDSRHFHLAYQLDSPTRLPTGVKEAIVRGLLAEKARIEDPRLFISSDHDSTLRDRLAWRKSPRSRSMTGK